MTISTHVEPSLLLPLRDTLLAPASGIPCAHQPALVTADGAIVSYDALRTAVDRIMLQLPSLATGKRLVHMVVRPELDSIATYLATLETGHVALVTSDEPQTAAIVDRYQPDLTATGDAARAFDVHSAEPLHVLHPDLALLLSTSGSTGSPKLVRLSRTNVVSNAQAIAAALKITSADRSITGLPLHYCFGLSVLHSHLVSGASVMLHHGSVLDESFWNSVDGHGVTNLAVVPHMVELMETTGVLEKEHPSLRLIAQAGGRMHQDRVLRTAALGREHGWGLSVMYGQTEATARICIMDEQLTADNPDSVGKPIMGTSIHLDHSVPGAADGAGEVVVRGPGVMMGYAEHPDDLALGAMLYELRTGDLGRVDDQGLLRIVGRRSGFVKIMGVRIDVSAVEQALEAEGYLVCVGGEGDRLLVAVEPRGHQTTEETVVDVRRIAGDASGLGVAAVAVGVAPLPRRSNGKIDRNGSADLVRAQAEVHESGHNSGSADSATARIAHIVSNVLGRDSVDLSASFVELGGDSLSHVQASVRLEKAVGTLPRGWHHLPLSQLASQTELKKSGTATIDAPFLRTLKMRHVETGVVLRALAVIAICASHADLIDVMGGAHLLLAVAGYSTVSYGLSVPRIADRWRALGRLLVGIVVPTMVIALIGMLAFDRYGWANVFLVNWLLGDTTFGSTHNEYWFIDSLVAGLMVLTASLSIPAVSRIWNRNPWRVAFWFTVATLIPRFVILAVSNEHTETSIMPTTVWLLGVGAAAAVADSAKRRWITVLLAVVGGATFFSDQPLRNTVIVAGILALILIPHLKVPALFVPVVAVLAAASLYIYLVQFMVFSAFENDWVETIAALTAGCLVWLIADKPMRRLQDLIPRTSGPQRTQSARSTRAL